jgi:hypothetical protein
MTLARKGYSMPEVFRKHYSYGETIPILDTNVGMKIDIFEVTDRPSPTGPYIKAVLSATAGPMKSLPLIVDPLQDSESKVVHLTDIPVPIAQVRTVDISLIFDIVNYRWTPSPEFPRDNGLVTFDLRLRAAFSLLGKSYTLQLDHRPCSLTLTKQLVPWKVPVAAGSGYEQTQQQQQFAGQSSANAERGSVPYGRPEGSFGLPGTINGGTEMTTMVTNQMDVEDRLRQLSQKLLARA